MIRLHEIFEDSAEAAQDSGQEFAFYRAVQFGFSGIILFYVAYHIAARYMQFSSLSPVWQLLIGQLPFVVCGAGGALLGLRKSLQKHGWRKVLDLPAELPCSKRQFCRELLKWTLLLVVAGSMLNRILLNLLEAFGFQRFPKQLLEIYGSDAGLFFWIVAFISTVIVAPVSEEILFRRILYQSLKNLNFSYAGLFTAFLFSLCHALPQALLAFMFFSLILQKACHKGSLWLAIGLHAAYNLILFAIKTGIIFFFSA